MLRATRPGGEVIAGNARLKAAKLLGDAEVPVLWFEGTDLEATAYDIADNRTHEFSRWGDQALADLLEELRNEDSLDGVGYSDDEIDTFLAELQDSLEPGDVDDPGPGAPPENPVTRQGDVWQLRIHRLVCGDVTDPDVVCPSDGGGPCPPDSDRPAVLRRLHREGPPPGFG